MMASSTKVRKRKADMPQSSPKMTVPQVCAQYNLTPLSVAYTADDMEQWTSHHLFKQGIFESLKEKNPSASKQALGQLVKAMWIGLKAINPFVDQDETATESDDEEESSNPISTPQDDPKSTPQDDTKTKSSINLEIDSDDAEPPVTKRNKVDTPASNKETDKSALIVSTTGRPIRSKAGRQVTILLSDDEEETSSVTSSKKKNSTKKQKQSRKRDDWEPKVSSEETVSSNSRRPVRSARPSKPLIISDDDDDADFLMPSEEEEEEEWNEDEEASDDGEEGVDELKTFREDRKHYDNCDACSSKDDTADLVFCETCPRVFHCRCLSEEPLVGKWYCPKCHQEGRAKKLKNYKLAFRYEMTASGNSVFCNQCKERGTYPGRSRSGVLPLSATALLECSSCVSSFHYSCMSARYKPNLPEDNPSALPDVLKKWRCPLCTAEKPLGTVRRLLDWRWDTFDEALKTTSTESKEESPEAPVYRAKEYFVLFKNMSYWKCTWLTEAQVKTSIATPTAFKHFENQEEVRPTLTPKKRHDQKHDKHKLYERFYCHGVRPEWLTPHKILAANVLPGHTKKMQYLVKWQDLSHDEATWEIPGSIKEVDLKPLIADYEDRTARLVKETSFKKSKKGLIHYDKQPAWVAGTLHPYQLDGLNWLRHCYSDDINTILADEMGLGKTIQAITFLYSLYKEGISNGPFIISAPLSTVTNWEREFQFWGKDFIVVAYTGLKESRAIIKEHELYIDPKSKHRAPKFHVLLTSYEFIHMDKPVLSAFNWEVLIVDEAHRLKNNQSKFFSYLNAYPIKYKLLLTGTPLQNNLEELFNLLNFMQPEKFDDMQGFLNEFSEISKDDQVKRLHGILGIHLLRRLKADVLKNIPAKTELIVRVELSKTQKQYYKDVLLKNIDALRGTTSKTSSARPVSLQNIMMDLRKVCNHPYLFPSAIDSAPLLPDGSLDGGPLVEACSKMQLMARMIPKLVDNGHRILVFSQMTSVLNLIEDFFDHVELTFERIDGTINNIERQRAIDRFNAKDSDCKIFLLSTRAGGLGINLATADTVFIYDSDWNPHNDMQALSRAHRMGQTKKVMVYRLVTRNTVEEKMLQTAKRKMMLTHLIVRPGITNQNNLDTETNTALSKKEVEEIIKFGTDNLFKDDEEADRIVYDDAAIDRLLDRDQVSELTEDETQSKGLNELFGMFKVADYEVKKGADESLEVESADSPAIDSEKEKENQADPHYWEKLLGVDPIVDSLEPPSDYDPSLGKGKRLKRQVNYSMKANLPQVLSDEEDEFEDQEEAYRPTEDGLPPLLSRAKYCQLVLGLNARQRKALLTAIMKFGLPTNGLLGPWLPRELVNQKETVKEAYLRLFLRHLQEDQEDSRKYSDGVPKEGLSRHTVLSRIGVMALIRRKVAQFETINGDNSLSSQTLENGFAMLPGYRVTTSITRSLEEISKFRFNILDGGLTEIHTVWHKEIDFIQTSSPNWQTNLCRIWNIRHDYWLLVATVCHGYGCFNDFLVDKRFSILRIPFANKPEIMENFISQRLRILEQALLIEEQLRRISYICCHHLANPSTSQEAEVNSAKVNEPKIGESDVDTNESRALIGGKEGQSDGDKENDRKPLVEPYQYQVTVKFAEIHNAMLEMPGKKHIQVIEEGKVHAAFCQLMDLVMDLKFDQSRVPGVIVFVQMGSYNSFNPLGTPLEDPPAEVVDTVAVESPSSASSQPLTTDQPSVPSDERVDTGQTEVPKVAENSDVVENRDVVENSDTLLSKSPVSNLSENETVDQSG